MKIRSQIKWPTTELHAFFYKKRFHKQRQAEIGKKLTKCYVKP